MGKRKYNDDFIIFRIDDCYPGEQIDIHDDAMIKEVARMGWNTNLDHHKNVKLGYIVYNWEIVRKFKIINHARIMLPPDEKHKKVRNRESVFIDFINDPKDRWIHRWIKYDKLTYQNPVHYGDENFLLDCRINLFKYYSQELPQIVTNLKTYYSKKVRRAVGRVKPKKTVQPVRLKKTTKASRTPRSKMPTRKQNTRVK